MSERLEELRQQLSDIIYTYRRDSEDCEDGELADETERWYSEEISVLENEIAELEEENGNT